jgi:hypothetical protein
MGSHRKFQSRAGTCTQLRTWQSMGDLNIIIVRRKDQKGRGSPTAGGSEKRSLLRKGLTKLKSRVQRPCRVSIKQL